jgi:cytochrome c oxidase cbb3-type subunit 4
VEITVFHGLWTAALLVIFVGIVVWAWSGKRKVAFDEAARIPLEDDEMEAGSAGPMRKHDD